MIAKQFLSPLTSESLQGNVVRISKLNENPQFHCIWLKHDTCLCCKFPYASFPPAHTQLDSTLFWLCFYYNWVPPQCAQGVPWSHLFATQTQHNHQATIYKNACTSSLIPRFKKLVSLILLKRSFPWLIQWVCSLPNQWHTVRWCHCLVALGSLATLYK